MRLNNKKGVNNGFAPGVLRFDVSAERTPSFTTRVPVAMVINTATYGNDGSLKTYWHGTNNHHHNPYGICATRVSWSGGGRKPKNSCIYPRHNWRYCVVFSLFGSVDAGCQYNLPKQVHNAPKWYWQLFWQAWYHLSGGFCEVALDGICLTVIAHYLVSTKTFTGWLVA